MEQTETFALRLREARERKKLTQKQLADMAEITAASVSAYEKIDGAKSPSIEIATKLAKALGVSLDWLAGLSSNAAKSNMDALDLSNIERPLDDYLRMFALLSGLGTVRIDQQRCRSEEYDYYSVISLVDLPAEFEEFCDGVIKLQTLLKDGTITTTQYADWLKGQLDKYSCFDVAIYDGKISVLEELPF